MPVIFYTYYDPAPLSVPEINRLENTLGRKLLFEGLSELFDMPCSSAVPGIDILTGEKGKPYLAGHPEICFNISHCRGLVVCAFDSSPVGVDAELTGYFPEVLINRVLTDDEKAILVSNGTDEPLRQEWFWRLWTLKEAYVKRTGIGVDTDLKAFSFSIERADDSYSPYSVVCSDSDVSCFQIMLESGHVISLCANHSQDDVTIVCR